mgnify:CR=1 FL=1
MHQLNPFSGAYNFEALTEAHPKLKKHLITSKKGEESIDFSDPQSVLDLNKALLLEKFNWKEWNLPKGFLCPPIPGRTDYLCHLTELVGTEKAHILDIGTGANAIYPIIGNSLFKWTFVGTDVDPAALKAARQNTDVSKGIQIRKQPQRKLIFDGIVYRKDKFDATMCNPPFFESADSASQANRQKNFQLHGIQKGKNFRGQSHELWTAGGEKRFIGYMIKESTKYKEQIKWFTTLVSNKKNIPLLTKWIENEQAAEVKVLEMQQGNKISRILAWRF